ncbi:hypothetical protein Brsp06_04466 [Brucella sp. NBRC 13694]|nr:hypothetical protein DR92_3246 [Brucella anthropi]SUB44174.1 Uncharacterised protein [Brucella anthropi]
MSFWHMAVKYPVWVYLRFESHLGSLRSKNLAGAFCLLCTIVAIISGVDLPMVGTLILEGQTKEMDMKIRAENLIAAVGELRVGLLAVRDLADTLLSLVEARGRITIFETGFQTWFSVHASRLP